MPRYRALPTLDRLNELLEIVEIPEDKYGEWSGLVWKIVKGGRAVGQVAGCTKTNPSRETRLDWYIGIDKNRYLVSRIIFYMAHKVDPKKSQIDHIDQNTLNNNISNLRLDTIGDIQGWNRPIRKDNKSGIQGVSWSTKHKKWKAAVQGKNSPGYIGLYECLLEACEAINDVLRNVGATEKGRNLKELSEVACSCSKCYDPRSDV